MKTLEQTKATIKEAYNELSERANLNTPDFYTMPTSIYNAIMKKLIYLEDALKDARKSNAYLLEVKRGDNRKIVQELESKRKYWETKYKDEIKKKNE